MMLKCLGFVIGVIVFAAFGSPAAARSASKPTVAWQVQAELGPDSPGGQPVGIAVASDGRVLVADAKLGLRVFSADGKEQEPLVGVSVTDVEIADVALTADDQIYLALPGNPDGAVAHYQDGQLTHLDSPGFHLESPASIAIDKDGLIYALDVTRLLEKSMSEVKVQRFDADGKYQDSFPALTADQLAGVGSLRLVAAPEGGVVLVTDVPNGVFAFDAAGKPVQLSLDEKTLGNLKLTCLAFGPDKAMAAAGKSGKILFDAGNGPVLFGSKAPGQGKMKAGTFYAPLAVALGPQNRVYVIDANSDYTQIAAIDFGTP